MPSMLPKASIQRISGPHILRSRLQSAYDIGVNYIRDLNKDFSVSIGFHFTIGKYNFFENFAPQEVGGFDGRNFLEGKDLWGCLRIPILVSKQFGRHHKNRFNVKAGLSLRYSGLNLDLTYGQSLNSSTSPYPKFYGDFPSYKKPWVTALAGISKTIQLRNYNLLSVGLLADLSTVAFFKGEYEIVVPNMSFSSGVYKVTGSSLGLSLNYIFTGANKVFIKKQILEAKKKRTPGLTRKKILNDYVFKGNHLQFYYSYNSIFKSRLKRETGTHPVSATSTAGFSFALKYAINFNNQNSLITGPQISMLGMNMTTRIAKDDFSPPLKSDYISGRFSIPIYMILSLPVLYEKRYFTNKGKYFYTSAGLKINFNFGADSEGFLMYARDQTNRSIYVGGWDVNANNNLWPWVSFPLHAGHSWLLKNNNVFQLGLQADISFTKYVDGVYEIMIPNKPITTGRYSNTGSYWGVSLQYLFTNANYRVRKAIMKTR